MLTDHLVRKHGVYPVFHGSDGTDAEIVLNISRVQCCYCIPEFTSWNAWGKKTWTRIKDMISVANAGRECERGLDGYGLWIAHANG